MKMSHDHVQGRTFAFADLPFSQSATYQGGTPLNNPLIDFCALLSKSKLHF